MNPQPSPDQAAAVEHFIEELERDGTSDCTPACGTDADVKWDPESRTAIVVCVDCGAMERKRYGDL